MNKPKIENYFSGKTTKEEELELLQYFSSKNIEPELLPYQKYFLGLADLKNHSQSIIQKEDYEDFTESPKNTAYYIKRFGITFATAASVALLVLFSPFFHKNKDYVVINGKKYTDTKHLELALHTSLENVKLDAQQIFNDLDNDLFN